MAEVFMRLIKNEHGSVLVFMTLMIVLLLVMVGMGLDTGHLAYIRSQGQPAVDAAALAATSGLQLRTDAAVSARAGSFIATNNYLDSKNNPISDNSLQNVTYAQYDPGTGNITTAGIDVTNANAVRVALETTNPYTGTAAGTSMASPLFLTPLFNVMGISVSNTANVSVSAVAALKAVPGLPLAIEEARCTAKNPQTLIQSSAKKDNSGWTTYYIPNASATEVKNLVNSAKDCSGGAPAVDVGYCTQLNNGNFLANGTDDLLRQLFAANPGKCYLLPVVKDNSNWNQCENITKWASFCPDAVNPVVTSGNDKWVSGTVSCTNINPYNQNNLNCYVPTLVRDTKSGM
jgi:Flp pilus assembly protein TadG